MSREALIGIVDDFRVHSIIVGMPAGGGDDPGMRGRPQGKVEAIKRQPGGSSIGQTEIADDLPFYSLRDPGYRAVIAVRHAAIEFARSETIGDQYPVPTSLCGERFWARHELPFCPFVAM